MGSRPVIFLWLWLAADLEPHCSHLPINKIWRWTESTPRSGWWRSHMTGIYSDCNTHEIIIIMYLNFTLPLIAVKCSDTVGWVSWRLGVMKNIQPVKKLSNKALAWLSVQNNVEIVCIWSGWHHCHSNFPSCVILWWSSMVLIFLCCLNHVVLKKRLLNVFTLLSLLDILWCNVFGFLHDDLCSLHCFDSVGWLTEGASCR